MTVATVATPPRVRSCVRCGDAPRYVSPDSGPTFMCAECLCSPAVRREIDEAVAADPERPRLYLMQRKSWRGGWGRAA